MRRDLLFKLRCVGLDPSEDRRVVDLDAAIEQHELQITVADGKHQITIARPKDHLGCELAPLEAITQTHSDARPIVPHSIIPELRQQRSLQQNQREDLLRVDLTCSEVPPEWSPLAQTHAFNQSPLSRASRPFIRSVLKGSFSGRLDPFAALFGSYRYLRVPAVCLVVVRSAPIARVG